MTKNNKNNIIPTYVSISEAAMHSGISQARIRAMVRNNELSHMMSGSKYLINYSKMLATFDSLEISA